MLKMRCQRKGRKMQFKLPELGEGVHEGELVKWKVKPGDQVGYDQSLCEIMTDKATVEIPSAFKGKVARLDAQEGQTVHVGQVMLTFEGAEGTATASTASSSASAGNGTSAHAAPAPAAAPSTSAPAMSAAPAKSPAAPVKTPSAPAASYSAGPAATENLSIESRPLAAPSTRKLAREGGVDLGRISGSGPHGRVMREDVETFIRGGGASSGAGAIAGGAPSFKAPIGRTSIPAGQLEERVPFKGLRKKIAEKMRLSKDHATHFTYVEEADATALVQLRAQAKEMGAKHGIKVTYLPFVMKAMVASLRKFPILNSSLDEEKQELVYKHYFNIGLSIQTEDGLTAPVVKDVANKSVLQIAKEIEDLVSRARAKKLTQDDFLGSTITLTNAGSIGGLFATPIINYPEVAILGFNKIFRKPVAVMVNGPGGPKEEVQIRDWTYFSISLDHRVVDGAVGAEFMLDFIKYIQNPSLLILEG
jgi:pyruvate dehydrogenase E2 component (dihydrolipoamide acetyltransferase)